MELSALLRHSSSRCGIHRAGVVDAKSGGEILSPFKRFSSRREEREWTDRSDGQAPFCKISDT